MIHLIDLFARKTIIIVGDAFLDDYLIGRAHRLSREAPIPVLNFKSRRNLPGGGANPAMNIVALGARAAQIGIIGADSNGETLQKLLAESGVDVSGLIIDDSRPTITKTRIVAESELRFPQQLARIDTQSELPLSDSIRTKTKSELRRLAANASAILFSDYRAGLIDVSLTDVARTLAREHSLLLTADAQGDLDKYRGFNLIKCNRAEAESYLNTKLSDEKDFVSALDVLLKRLEAQAILVTRGAQGLSIIVKDIGYTHLPATNIAEVYDVTGAGDTVIAVATLALASGADPVEAARLANIAGGIAVRGWGNVTVTREELRLEIGD
ncbi:MAG: bifunctional hydroxymethylpyrimidine kinase/phosphomethylpyrimidine kinase [Chloroflexi bacterium]|nr:bifunctional hydroxymethylpyrimidine kinase/phosphomethylpyrimidine kinase [Chloroflexota bacterium]